MEGGGGGGGGWRSGCKRGRKRNFVKITINYIQVYLYIRTKLLLHKEKIIVKNIFHRFLHNTSLHLPLFKLRLHTSSAILPCIR